MFAPKVSIIIPAYNAESTLSRCINSVLSQCYPNIEIIVVDDGSKDSTVKVAELFFDKINLYTQENSGACAARNLGIKKSQGEYIKFLDSDDFLSEGSISRQVEVLEGYSDEKVIPYGYRDVLYKNKLLSVKDVVSEDYQMTDLINNNITITLPLHRRKSLVEVGFFDEKLKFRQEWDIHLRLSYNGFLFKYHNDCIFTQVVSDSIYRISSRKLIFKDEVENLDYIRKKYSCISDKGFDQAWSKKYWDLARQFVKLNNNKDAESIFEISRSISNVLDTDCYPFFYRLIVRVGGPFFAEKLISFYKRIS